MRSRASVVGLGTIGASIALALRRSEWLVAGSDIDKRHLERARVQGVIDSVVDLVDPDSSVVFIAVPPLAIPDVFSRVWPIVDADCVISDTGSVKTSITEMCNAPNFVPGHPMTGSELSRLEGATASLFEGTTWILTPRSTDEGALARIAHLIQQSFKAELRLMEASQHDDLVAAISHVPHLLATSLVNSAFEYAEGHESILARMASGSFRDMTRVASGDPAIWLDICKANRSAITKILDQLVSRLAQLNSVLRSDEEGVIDGALSAQFRSARTTRQRLPEATAKQVELVVTLSRDKTVRDVLAVATSLDVNVRDFYAAEGLTGTGLHLSVAASEADLLRGGLTVAGLTAHKKRNISN